METRLQGLLRTLVGQGAQGVNLFGLEDQGFLAEDVLAAFERRLGDGEVHEERRGDEDRVQIRGRQEFAIVLELLGVGADGLGALVEIGLVDVANGGAEAVVDAFQMLQEVLATAAGANEAVADFGVGAFHLLNPGRTGDEAGGGYRADRRCLDGIAPGKVFGFAIGHFRLLRGQVNSLMHSWVGGSPGRPTRRRPRRPSTLQN